ncbi:MIP/aquaporin family protein [Angustibacter speluncae]
MSVDLPRRLAAEGIGTGLLVAVVVGSGVMARRLSPDDAGLQLLQGSTATALGLAVLVVWLGPVSGAQLNPVVTLAAAWWHRRAPGSPAGDRPGPLTVAAVVAVQVAGAVAGTALAHAMFAVPGTTGLLATSTTARGGAGQLLGEVVATAGLVALVGSLVRTGRTALAGPAVGAWVGAAYWWTSSTSFANPAVTLGRALTDTATGIAPPDVPGFVAAQLLGGLVGLALVAVLHPVVRTPPASQDALLRPTTHQEIS